LKEMYLKVTYAVVLLLACVAPAASAPVKRQDGILLLTTISMPAIITAVPEPEMLSAIVLSPISAFTATVANSMPKATAIISGSVGLVPGCATNKDRVAPNC
jgi:hypothetical protein